MVDIVKLRALGVKHDSLRDLTIAKAANEIEYLRDIVHGMGEQSGVCTFNALGSVCGYCGCHRKPDKQEE